MILLGAVPVSLLALLFDFIFAKLEQAVTSEGLLPNEQIQNLPKKVIRRRQVIAVGVCVALVVVAIGGNLVNKKSDKHLTVGASNFTEVYIVGNIYKELIEPRPTSRWTEESAQPMCGDHGSGSQRIRGRFRCVWRGRCCKDKRIYRDI